MSQLDLPNGKIENVENKSKISIIDACENIFFSNSLEGKLVHYSNIDWTNKIWKKKEIITPARPANLQFSENKTKFPKDPEFKQTVGRAKALHFFANHELLAIEVMALMILVLPGSTEHDWAYKKEIWKTLLDEQRHLSLYQNRLQELGYAFGDFTVNDFFWKIFSKVDNFKQYFSLMSLTFESANLDFAFFYSNLFEQVGDFSSSQLMRKIYHDEIHHVKLGVNYFEASIQPTIFWQEYISSLPWPITPARSKGINYNDLHRVKAGFPKEFIMMLNQYQDPFKVTDRRR